MSYTNYFRKRYWESALLILGIVFSILFFVTQMLHFDNGQIFEKVLKVLNEGVWTHHGNAGTGVGFVPGTFLTAIAAVPMMIWYSPYAAASVIILTHILAYYLLRDIVRSVSVFLIPLLALIFWINPWRVEQAELYNPAYLFMFGALHFWTSIKMQNKDWKITFLHVLSIGFCAQVHYSAIILAFASLLLFYKGRLKVHWWGFIASVLVVLGSLVPWFLETIHHPQFGVKLSDTPQSSVFFGKNALLVYPVLKAVLYWIRFGSTYYARHIFSEIRFDWILNPFLQVVISSLYHTVKYLFALITLIWSGRWMFQNFKKLWSSFHLRPEKNVMFTSLEDQILDYGFYLFLAMLVAAGLSPVEFNHWHFIVCFPYVSVLTVLGLQHFLNTIKFEHAKKVLYTILVFFLIQNFFGAMGSRTHSFRNNFHKDFLFRYSKPQAYEIEYIDPKPARFAEIDFLFFPKIL